MILVILCVCVCVCVCVNTTVAAAAEPLCYQVKRVVLLNSLPVHWASTADAGNVASLVRGFTECRRTDWFSSRTTENARQTGPL